MALEDGSRYCYSPADSSNEMLPNLPKSFSRNSSNVSSPISCESFVVDIVVVGLYAAYNLQQSPHIPLITSFLQFSSLLLLTCSLSLHKRIKVPLYYY